MDRIEPCPCCGGPGKLKDTAGKIRQGWVGCPACSLYIGWKIDPAGAIRKWNRRADVAPVRRGRWVDIRVTGPCSWSAVCSCCFVPNDIPPPPDAHYCPNCGAQMEVDNG